MGQRLAASNRYILIGDLFLIVVSVLGSFVLRLNMGPLLIDHLGRALVMLALALVIKPIIYYRFGLYRRLWVYASIQELKLITVAVTTASVLLSLIITLLTSAQVFPGFARSVLVIDWLLSLFLVGGLRFSLRILAETTSTTKDRRKASRALIIGAGDAGALVVRELQKAYRSEVNSPQFLPVCFLDDDPVKQNQEIHGVPVVGTLKELARIIDTKRIDEVILAIPSAPGQVVRKVTDVCLLKSTPFRTMPSIHELIGGKVSVSRLREVDITDLLRREPTRINGELVGASIKGRRILVTGAGGSIGREVCRQVARWEPAELVLLGHGENSIFDAMIDISENFPTIPLHAAIADIRDKDRLQNIFLIHQPQIIFHAAAHKHVPLMEANIEEAVINNVLGTRNIVEVSIGYPVERLVMISSDKAVQPSSIMGATKRIAEMIVLDTANRADRAFTIVRFGNVLGSRGSIVPHFKRQIARGGPVTITHPDMQRYFMTIPEAVHLVLQASAMGKGGETYVLNMGEQVRILDLAEDLIRLSGLEPGKDIEIVFTGIRPGEKLSEMLWDEGADYQPTIHPDILLLASNDFLQGETLQKAVDELIHLARQGKSEALTHLLRELIPGSVISTSPPPDLTAVV